MKRITLSLTAILLAGILFTSASPSLDGRAVVANEGVFPRGFFAKTVGYLPGDSIKVTNPTNGKCIDILVIGSLDPSEGVAILLSPEAAETLLIKKNSNNLVKITKRSGNADDVASGSAIVTMDSSYVERQHEEVPKVGNTSIEDFSSKTTGSELAKIDDIPDEYINEDIPKSELAELDSIPDEYIYNDNKSESEYVKADDIPYDDEFAVIKTTVPESDTAADYIPNENEFVETEYDAIVLIPTDSNPPDSNKTDKPLEIVQKPIETDSASKKELAYVTDNSQLVPQKYYVQIAVYNKAENAEEVNDIYGSRYPLVVFDKGSRKIVMVGPLNIDEYGTVLERFRAYGFTDAFAKKIK